MNQGNNSVAIKRKSKICYCVLKLVPFGELYQFLENTEKFSSLLARTIFLQLIEGILYHKLIHFQDSIICINWGQYTGMLNQKISCQILKENLSLEISDLPMIHLIIQISSCPNPIQWDLKNIMLLNCSFLTGMMKLTMELKLISSLLLLLYS